MPPKDQRVIDSTYRLVRYFIANAQTIYPILYSALRELVDSNDEKKLFAKLTNYKFKKSEIEQSGITVEELRDNIENNYTEWLRQRDWFANHLIEQLKKNINEAKK